MTFLKVFSFPFLVESERNPCACVSHVLSAGSDAKRLYSIRSSVAEKEGQNFSDLALFAGVSHGRMVPPRAIPQDFFVFSERGKPYVPVQSVLVVVFLWQRGKIVWQIIAFQDKVKYASACLNA